ncbi:hypothetical protein D3C71_1478960 [compost metagenome]
MRVGEGGAVHADPDQLLVEVLGNDRGGRYSVEVDPARAAEQLHRLFQIVQVQKRSCVADGGEVIGLHRFDDRR